LYSLKITPVAKETIIHLDTFGSIVPSLIKDKYNGDKIFDIDSLGKVTVY